MNPPLIQSINPGGHQKANLGHRYLGHTVPALQLVYLIQAHQPRNIPPGAITVRVDLARVFQFLEGVVYLFVD